MDTHDSKTPRVAFHVGSPGGDEALLGEGLNGPRKGRALHTDHIKDSLLDGVAKVLACGSLEINTPGPI